MSGLADVERCDSCDGLNFAWYADSRLWNEVVGGDPDKEATGLLCPACFAERADAHFEGTKWRVTGWRLVPDMRRVTVPSHTAVQPPNTDDRPRPLGAKES